MNDRRRHGNVSAAVHPPQFLAGRQVVAADMLETIHDHLRAAVRRMHGRGAPRRVVVPCCPPEFSSRRNVEGGQERALEHVGLDDHTIAVNDRRARKSPLRLWHLEESGLQQTQVLPPQQLPAGVVGKQPFGSEHRHEPSSVGRERRVRMRSLRMALDLRHPLVSDGAPALRTILLVEAVHLPAERRRIVHRRDVAVESDFERLFLALCDRRRHAHHVAPDDGTGVRETGDGCRPADVLAGGSVPSLRKRQNLRPCRSHRCRGTGASRCRASGSAARKGGLTTTGSKQPREWPRKYVSDIAFSHLFSLSFRRLRATRTIAAGGRRLQAVVGNAAYLLALC